MAKQNIYDNDTFFQGYKGIRDNEANANNLFEIPALYSLLPDLTGKRVLDLGCGYGEHCKHYVAMGAVKVIGIDISSNMLDVARRENSDSAIEYRQMAMEDIGEIGESFDVIVSSLALHYVEDYAGVVQKVYRLLNKSGIFVFSQEHPLMTCFSGGKQSRWTRDDDGNKLYLNLSKYGYERENESAWFVDNVKKYHRTFSTIVNTLIDAGFQIDRFIEPLPSEELLEKYPEYSDLFHKPDFLLVKALKKAL